MNTIKRVTLATVLLFFIIMGLELFGQNNSIIRFHPLHKKQKIYGRVVDFDNNPVVEAIVVIHINPKFDHLDYLRVQTDKDGYWDAIIPPSYSLQFPSLYGIYKYGYEWDRDNDIGFQEIFKKGHYALTDALLATTQKKRIVNMMRKKKHVSYLIGAGYNGRFGFNHKRSDGYYNFISLCATYSENRNELCKGYVQDGSLSYDLWFHAEHKEDAQCWELTITPAGKQAGIQEWRGDKRYDAPIDGYQKQLTLCLNYDKKEERILYVKTRDFPLYSEVHLATYASPLSYASPLMQINEGEQIREKTQMTNWLNVKLDEVIINPFGKRWLEEDIAFSFYPSPTTGEEKKKEEEFNGFQKKVRPMLMKNILPDESEVERLKCIPDYSYAPNFAPPPDE